MRLKREKMDFGAAQMAAIWEKNHLKKREREIHKIGKNLQPCFEIIGQLKSCRCSKQDTKKLNNNNKKMQ